MGRVGLYIPSGDYGRTFTQYIISTFMVDLSPAMGRLDSLGATMSRTIAGYVIRNCHRRDKGVCVGKGVASRGGIVVAVHSGNYKVSSVGGTVRPLFAATPSRSETKLNFTIVRDFYSGIHIHSGPSDKAAMALRGVVNSRGSQWGWAYQRGCKAYPYLLRAVFEREGEMQEAFYVKISQAHGNSWWL